MIHQEDKFTESARLALTRAGEEAQSYNHNYIGTEHLLLGIVRDEQGMAAGILKDMDVELPKIHSTVQYIIGRGNVPVTNKILLTPHAKRIIELAVEEAKRLNHNYVSTEHLLLAIAWEGEGIAAGILESLGVSLEKLRKRIIQQLKGESKLAGRPQEERRNHMPDRFEVFNESARLVLTRAQEEAQRFNHNYIGTEHLLLGLIRDDTSVAARVLNDMDVQLSKIRSSVEFIIGSRQSGPAVREIGLTPRAKKVIDLTVEEARRLNHHYIGAEHLLLGLVAEDEGIAAGVLKSLNVELEPTRQRVKQAVERDGK